MQAAISRPTASFARFPNTASLTRRVSQFRKASCFSKKKTPTAIFRTRVADMSLSAAQAKDTCVLFDFDGTLGDTETPAMEVAYWELVPYFPNYQVSDVTEEFKAEFIRDSAGKAFEFMVEKCDKDRAQAGLPPIHEIRAAKGEDPEMLAFVDRYREKFGLQTFAQMRGPGGEEPADILTLQKDDTVLALETLAEACPGVKETLGKLEEMGVRFAIATTSGKPRVPVSVKASGLSVWFSPGKIHSGESDFDPPRFKPDPSVYLLAAESEAAKIEDCIAVEDSASGVGSASNAGVGMIVGYVGASHIKEAVIDSHAKMLMDGTKADNGIGADIVIEDFSDLLTLVSLFQEMDRARRPVPIPDEVVKSLKGRHWLRAPAMSP